MPVPGLTANARKKKGAKKRPSKRDITSEMEKENAAVIPDSANMNDSPDPQDGEHHNKRPRLTPGGSPLEKDGKAINEKKRSAPSPIIQKAGGNKNAAKRRVLQTIPGSDALGTGKGADGPDAGGGAEDENPTALEFGRASGGTGGLNQMAGRKRTGVQLRQCPLVAINIPKPKAATPRPQPSGTVKTSLLAHAEELLKAKDATVTLDSSDDEEDVSEPPSNQGAGTERDIAAAPVASALAGTSVTADKGGAGSKKASKMNAPASQATDAPVQGRGSNGIENASRAQNRNHSLDAQKINTVHVQYGKLLDKYKQLEAEKFGKIEEAFELQRQRVASYTEGFLGLMEEAEVNSEDENEPQSLAAWQRWVGALPGITSRVGGLASGSTIPTMVFTHGASGFRFELGPVPSKAVAGEEEEHVEYSFEVNKGEESPEAHIEELYFCCQSVGALTGDLPSWIEEDEDGICFTADMAKKLIMELERILSSQIFDQQ